MSKFKVGDVVKIDGQLNTKYNGLKGIVVAIDTSGSYDWDTYHIMLEDGRPCTFYGMALVRI